MLLACCFREPNKKKTKKKTKKSGNYQKIKENEVRQILFHLNSLYFNLFRNKNSRENTIYLLKQGNYYSSYYKTFQIF